MQAVLLVLLLLLVPGSPRAVAAEGFADGLAAYDGGDYEETVRIWGALAAGGDANAQVALAGLYRSGEGVGQDLGQAAALYRDAALQGNEDAQLNLGRMYADGAGVARDPIEAWAWLSLAADQGRAWADQRRQELAATMTGAQRQAARARLAVLQGS